MKKKKIMFIFGTRPEAIKLGPLIKKVEESKEFDSRIVITAQHREMLDQILRTFEITPHHDLNIMQPAQSLFDISVRALRGLQRILEKESPAMVVVQGDTTTTFVGALSAFYHKIPVAHVEAGLRSFERYKPFPEEMNRILTSHLSTLHFAPTKKAKENLIREGIDEKAIFVTGNTVIDALLWVIQRKHSFKTKKLRRLHFKNKKTVLVTTHRRENWGKPIEEILRAILRLVEKHKDIEVVFSLHRNPVVRNLVKKYLGNIPRVHLVDHLDYEEFCHLMKKSYLILTDSGGIQEEGPSVGTPVLVLREVTERPEGVEAGTVRIAGVREESIFKIADLILSSPEEYEKMAKAHNPYGDGKAAERIVSILKRYFNSPFIFLFF